MGLQYVENVMARSMKHATDYRAEARPPHRYGPSTLNAWQKGPHRPLPHARNCLLYSYLPFAICTECPRC